MMHVYLPSTLRAGGDTCIPNIKVGMQCKLGRLSRISWYSL